MQINAYQTVFAAPASNQHSPQNSVTNKGSNTSSGANEVNQDRYTFSDKALKFMSNFEMSDAGLAGFKNIMADAIQTNAYSDPKSFLASLSVEDRTILQKSHGIAAPFDVAKLSHEGAYNLLLPPAEAKDLDNNGLVTTATAQGWQYPPVNAPANVHVAWEETTKDMSEGDRLMFQATFIVTSIEANLHFDNAGNPVGVYEPSDPEYTNPWAEPNFSYQAETEKFLARLEAFKSQTPSEQYERQKEQLSALLDAFKKHNVT